MFEEEHKKLIMNILKAGFKPSLVELKTMCKYHNLSGFGYDLCRFGAKPKDLNRPCKPEECSLLKLTLFNYFKDIENVKGLG